MKNTAHVFLDMYMLTDMYIWIPLATGIFLMEAFGLSMIQRFSSSLLVLKRIF